MRKPNVRPLCQTISDTTKRAIDIVASAILLVLLSPLFVLLALLIRHGSKGPVFFRQERVGRASHRFRILKFRTMHTGADKQGPLITSSDDTRVTPIGRVLRSTKLDELPQLVNVLRGDMSLVGPRPQVPRFVDQFPPHLRDIILAVRPGVTGPTQIQFRHEENLLQGLADRERYYIEELLPIKCRMDVEYVQRRSLWYDLRVLHNTAWTSLPGTHARVYSSNTRGAEQAAPVRIERHRGDRKAA